MFPTTESVTKNMDNSDSYPYLHSPQKTKTARVDLMEMIDFQQEEGDCDEIQTFDDFLQAVNGFNFQKNQQEMRRQPKLSKKRTLQHKQSIGYDRGSNFLTNRHFSLKNNQPETTNQPGFMFLDVVREELISRGSNKNLLGTNQQTNQKSINIPTFQQNQLYSSRANEVERSNSFRQSSAQSSRSFNGFQQINQYQIKQQLGSGAFSSVHLCRDIHTDKLYAVKILLKKTYKKKLLRKNSEMIADNFMRNQIAILKKMQHPYIIKLYQVIQDEVKNKIYLILDYCANGFINEKKKIMTGQDGLMKNNSSLLSDFDSPYRKLLESECKRYFKQLAPAMDYLHNVAKIAHRDIKPENILLSQRDQVRVSDFGLGTEDIEVRSKSGTARYMAPQTKNQDPTKKVNSQLGDIWALGITLIVMLHGKMIQFEDQSLPQLIKNLKDVSNECKDFLRKCLTINPLQRITASDMLDHPWIMAKKPPQNFTQIEITQEQEKYAIIKRHRDILTQITRMHL